MSLTEPDAHVLEELAAEIRQALGPDLLGLYLSGSAAAGGFDEDVSDLDLVAITRAEVADLDLGALAAMHERFEDTRPAWRGRIEVVYVGEASLAGYREAADALAVVSPGEPFHRRADPLSDWAANWYLVREGGVTLLGADARAAFPDVPRTEFVAGVVRYADELRGRDRTTAHPGEIAYELLTLARALVLVRTGRPVSKQEAAAWVSERWPVWAPLFEEALATRRSRGRSGFDAASRREAEACIERLHEAIHATDS